MDESPVLSAALLTAAVGAALAVAAAFGAPITDDQKQAILACIPPFFALVVAMAALVQGHTVSKNQARRIKNATFVIARRQTPVAAASGELVPPTMAQVERFIDEHPVSHTD